MTEDVYRTLQQRLDLYSIGFPATQSGIELKILEKLFSQTDAAMFLKMTPRLETVEQVALRTAEPKAELADTLEDMVGRGLLFRTRRGGPPSTCARVRQARAWSPKRRVRKARSAWSGLSHWAPKAA